jgi:nucleoside-diphosphate-sugar epimerase
MPLGAELTREGHKVFGLRRSLEAESEGAMRAAGIEPVTGDVTRPADLQGLPGSFDWVVNTVSSSRGGPEVYKEVFLKGTQNLVSWLTGTSIVKYVYTSSTSVYGQTNGQEVTETSPTEPASPTSQLLVETEKVLMEAAGQLPAVILRLAGIYGPGRGHLFLQYLQDKARLYEAGERIINMIHLNDAVGSVHAALDRGRAGEVYNVVDDEPVKQRVFFEWLADQLHKPMPPAASLKEITKRKRGVTNKKVSNRKLRADLGYRCQYPTFREGYTKEIQRLQRAGQLTLSSSD